MLLHLIWEVVHGKLKQDKNKSTSVRRISLHLHVTTSREGSKMNTMSTPGYSHQKGLHRVSTLLVVAYNLPQAPKLQYLGQFSVAQVTKPLFVQISFPRVAQLSTLSAQFGFCVGPVTLPGLGAGSKTTHLIFYSNMYVYIFGILRRIFFFDFQCVLWFNVNIVESYT